MDKNVFEQYADRFGENFPLFGPFPEDKTMEQVAEECLKKGKPYHYETEADKVY